MTDDPNEAIRMEINGLVVDPASKMPIVVLRDEVGQTFLPIWIGNSEAHAIALRIQGVVPPRPLTHDLLRAFLERLGATVERVVISDLRDNTFYARIHIVHDGEELVLDSRPSDAIALALRTESPIYALRLVLQKAEVLDLAGEPSDEEKTRKQLEDLEPDDLGKYKM